MEEGSYCVCIKVKVVKMSVIIIGISLLSVPAKVWEQGGFRKGKEFIDVLFVIKMMVEEYLGKDKKLYA